MTAYTFTLSRAHAVADRFRKAAEAKRDQAMEVLSGKTLSHSPSDEQVTALTERGQQALLALAAAREGLLAVGRIREALGSTNAAVGVTQLLSQIESKKQEARLLTQITGVDLLALLPVSQAAAAFKERAQETGSYRAGIHVGLVPFTSFDSMRGELAVLTATISALSDQVNDLNKKTLTVELPEDLAKEAGL